jgi:hypothetical protein
VKYPTLLSDKSLTVIIGNQPFQTDRSNPHWEQIKAALKDDTTTDDFLIGLIQPINAVAAAFQNHAQVTIQGGQVLFGTHVISNALATRLLDVMNEGFDVEPWLKFANNVYSNPNDWSRDELYLFLERCNLPITDDGCFIAYKKVNANYTDCHSGSIDNSIGNLVVMPGGRSKVDPDRERTCSYGLHFCSKEYLTNFGGARTLLVKINPADVVSIPNDYDNTKGRCWRYEVVGEIPMEVAKDIAWKSVEAGYGDYQWGPEDDLDDEDEDTIIVFETAKSYEDWLKDDNVEDDVPATVVTTVKIDTVGNGVIDAERFLDLLNQCSTLAGISKHLGVSAGTVQAWKTKLFPK